MNTHSFGTKLYELVIFSGLSPIPNDPLHNCSQLETIPGRARSSAFFTYDHSCVPSFSAVYHPDQFHSSIHLSELS